MSPRIAGTGVARHQQRRFFRSLWELERADAGGSIACFGGIAFWSDGIRLACRVIAPGSKPGSGFDIALRA